MIDIGLYSTNLYTLQQISDALKEQQDINVTVKYAMINYNDLSVDSIVDTKFGFDRKQIVQPEYKVADLSLILRLDNLYVYRHQLENDTKLNEILGIFDNKGFYVIYTNDLVKGYIEQKYPNIKLILSEYRYSLDSLDTFIESLEGRHIEINSSIYSEFIPYIEYGKIKTEQIWVSLNRCVFCDIRKTCVKSRSFCNNHKMPIIDIFPSIWKYHIPYEDCYMCNLPLSIEDIKYRIKSIKNRGITKFLIGDFNLSGKELHEYLDRGEFNV